MKESNPQSAQISVALEQLRNILSKQGVSSSDQDKVLLQLTRAISSRLVVELDKKLTQGQRQQLQESRPDELADLIQYYQRHLPAPLIQEAFNQATQQVMRKFLLSIQG